MSKRKRASERIASLVEQKRMGISPSKQPRIAASTESIDQPGETLGSQDPSQPEGNLDASRELCDIMNNVRGWNLTTPKKEEPAPNWLPKTPDSTKTGSQLPSFDRDASKDYTASASEKPPGSSPHLLRSSSDRRSWDQNSPTEVEGTFVLGQNPFTKKQVFRRVVVKEKVVYQITCRKLVSRIFLATDSSNASLDSGDVYEKLRALIDKPTESDMLSGDLLQHAKWLEGLVDFATREPKLEICLHNLYPLASTVFKVDEGGLRAYKVGCVESTEDATHVHAYYLGFAAGGKSLLPLKETITIPKYMATQTINTLGLLPDWYVSSTQPQKTEAKLVNRGEKFWGFRGKPVHREYDGEAWLQTGKTPTRVVVDYTTSSKHEESTVIEHNTSRVCSRCLYDALGFPPPPPDGVKYLTPHDTDICSNEQVSGSSSSEDREGNNSLLESGDKKRATLLKYCPSTVWAFSLVHNSWKTVPVDSLQVFKYRGELWDQLYAVDTKQRDDLSSAVEFFGRDTSSKGLRILLRGNTGMGKTFTVECLAEKHGRPLYTLPCSSLGCKPDVLDTCLREAFQRARNWGAILFLDKADFFMYGKSIIVPEHIALIYLFRQALERAASGGALVFLTASNSRPPDRDFESCVDMSLVIPNLTFTIQKRIWISAIRALGLDPTTTTELCDFIKSDDTDGLEKQNGGAFKDLTGWEIHGCLRAAAAIAKRGENGAVCLLKENILAVLNLGQDFDDFRANRMNKIRERRRLQLANE